MGRNTIVFNVDCVVVRMMWRQAFRFSTREDIEEVMVLLWYHFFNISISSSGRGSWWRRVVGAGWLPTALSEGGSGVAGCMFRMKVSSPKIIMARKASALTRAMWGVVRFGGSVSGGESWNGREELTGGSTGGVQGLETDGIE
jgi:hypothetical protein